MSRYSTPQQRRKWKSYGYNALRYAKYHAKRYWFLIEIVDLGDDYWEGDVNGKHYTYAPPTLYRVKGIHRRLKLRIEHWEYLQSLPLDERATEIDRLVDMGMDYKPEYGVSKHAIKVKRKHMRIVKNSIAALKRLKDERAWQASQQQNSKVLQGKPFDPLSIKIEELE